MVDDICWQQCTYSRSTAEILVSPVGSRCWFSLQQLCITLNLRLEEESV